MNDEKSPAQPALPKGPEVYTEEPATEADLTQLQADVLKVFGSVLPEDYIAFLRRSDGMQIGNATFMAAADVVPLNADCPTKGMIRIGDAGNLDDFFFDVRARTFLVARMGRHSEVHSSHTTFWELLSAVSEEQRNEESDETDDYDD